MPRKAFGGQGISQDLGCRRTEGLILRTRSKKTLEMLDFDNIDYWAPRLTAVLRPHVPNSIEQKLGEATQEYEYIKDVQDRFFDLTDK